MPRNRPPHLQREVTRHGRVVWFVRIGKGPRVRIRDDYGTDEFWESYRSAVVGTARPAAGKPSKGSLKWLIGQYRDSTALLALVPATRRQRENIFTKVLETAGDERAAHDLLPDFRTIDKLRDWLPI